MRKGIGTVSCCLRTINFSSFANSPAKRAEIDDGML